MSRGARLSASGQNAGVMEVLLERNLPHAPPPSRGSRYRPDIQGLRALAVLAVIANHLAGWPKGSFVGVDVFFVISGYLITGILVREFETRQTISLLGFYARRIKRILPAGLFVIGVTLCATRVLAGIDRYHFTAADAIAAVEFRANWHFAQAGVNYFNQSLPPSPLQHYWSLSVEEQFYFVWPWVLLGLLLIGRRLRWWRHEHTRPVAGVAIAVISGVSLAWAFAQTAGNPTTAYFSTLDRAWELGLGALIAIAGAPDRAPNPRLRLDRRMARPSRPAPVTPHRPLVPWVSRAVGAAPHPLRRGGDRHGRRPPGAVAAAADQPGLPVRGRPLLQPLPVALPGRRAHRHPRPPLLGHLLGGGSGAHLRLVGRLISPAGEPGAARHLVCPSSRTPPVPARGWLLYAAACVATALLAGAGLVLVRSISPSRLVLPAPAPGWPHAGRPARLPGCGGP